MTTRHTQDEASAADAAGAANVADAALLVLWERARRVALRRCARTLVRLRAGQGGFYEPEDLMQDLFLEFWALLRRQGGHDGPDLWQAWERVLGRGALRVLRRKPQRLWGRAEHAVAPEVLESADPCEDGEPPLPAAVRESLVARADGAHGEPCESPLDDLEEALWRLTPVQRQVLYLLALRGVPAVQIARRLRLRSAGAVYQRAARARRALDAELGRPGGPEGESEADGAGGEAPC